MDTSEENIWSDEPISKSQLYRKQRRDRSSIFHDYLNTITGDTPRYSKQALTQIIFYFLCTTPYDDRFFFTKIPQILEESAESEHFDIEKASKAFQHLETYILLIAESPWKAELKQLKLYNGFFRVKVQAHLSQAVEVLAIIGFEEKGTDTLQLSKTVNLDLCYKVAFDMLVASVECQFLTSAFCSLLPQGFVPSEIIKAHRFMKGDVPIFVQYVETNCKSILRKQSGRFSDSNVIEKDTDVLIDKQLQEKRSVLKESRKSTVDSGYLSFGNSSNQHRATVRPKPLGQTPDNYDTPNIFNQPLYEEGTVDDHISAASRIIASAPSKRPLKGSTSMGPYGSNAGSEWNFVRDTLLKKYGNSYYDGERGDILQTRPSRPILDHSLPLDMLAGNTKTTPGNIIQQKAGSPKLPPRVSSASRSSPHRLPDRLPDFNKHLDPVVNYPPPLVCRGSKPSYLPPRVGMDESDCFLSEDCGPQSPTAELHVRPYKPTPVPRRKSPSDLLFGDVDTTASTKMALFKNKLQNYERLEQQLSFNADQPNMETNSFENSSWICPTCTFSNQAGERICSVCGKSGDSGPDLTYQQYARVCSQCTFNNEPDARTCTMCEIDLERFETVV